MSSRIYPLYHEYIKYVKYREDKMKKDKINANDDKVVHYNIMNGITNSGNVDSYTIINGKNGENYSNGSDNGMMTYHREWLRKYIHTMIAGGVELTVGQPLDRIKIYYQTPITQRNGTLLYPTFKNWRYWYAGNSASMIQRCGIYFPGITASSQLASNIIPDANSVYSMILKPLIVSVLVSPYVTLFESVKNIKQRSFINSELSIYKIIKQNGTRRLFAAWFPTLGREYFFAGGMLVFQPVIADKLHSSDKYYILSSNSSVSTLGIWVASSLLSSTISQAVSQPLDTWKTRIELKPDVSIWTTIREIPARQLWSGLTPRIIRGAWTFGCINAILHYLE